MRHQLEHRAVSAAALKLAAPALCKPVAAQFGERSCAAPVVAEQLALPQLEALAEHPRKPALPAKTLPQPAEQWAVLEEQQPLKTRRVPILLVA